MCNSLYLTLNLVNAVIFHRRTTFGTLFVSIDLSLFLQHVLLVLFRRLSNEHECSLLKTPSHHVLFVDVYFSVFDDLLSLLELEIPEYCPKNPWGYLLLLVTLREFTSNSLLRSSAVHIRLVCYHTLVYIVQTKTDCCGRFCRIRANSRPSAFRFRGPDDIGKALSNRPKNWQAM